MIPLATLGLCLAPALTLGLLDPGAARAVPPAPGTPREAAGAGGLLTREEALELAFGDCTIERRPLVVTPEQKQRIEELARADLGPEVVFAYVARRAGAVVGTAWFDTDRVRSLKQTLMVVVDPGGRVRRVELLAFAEPREYVPRPAFYAQFVGKPLDDELEIKRAIRGVAGATLTARATTRAVRRCLALQAVLLHSPPTPPAAAPTAE